MAHTARLPCVHHVGQIAIGPDEADARAQLGEKERPPDGQGEGESTGSHPVNLL